MVPPWSGSSPRIARASAQVAGRSRLGILGREILPNVAPTILALLTLEMGIAVIVEAILSFVNLSIPTDDPTWGGTSYTFVYGINGLLGGSKTNFAPGLNYLKKLDPNIITYPRESIYNAVLSGEIPIWINADGNGYKMKYQDKGNVLVVIPREGSFSMPLVMGMVKGAPHPEETKKYLDWLLTKEAQAEMARGYFRPVISGAMPADIARQFLPAADYKRVRNLSLADSAAAADALKKAWTDQVRR